MESLQTLPPPSHLSPSALSFLDRRFHTKLALAEAPSLVAELQTQCSELDRSLAELTRRLGLGLAAYASFSGGIHGLFSDVNDRLNTLASTCSSSVVSDGGRGERDDGKGGKGFREELAALAKEVARLETVRVYAETALKLDTLVGDIEDAVSYTMSKNLRKHSSNQNSEEMRLVAIKTLRLTEEILTSITKAHPQWKHLVSAVDHRVDRALAILRPQAIADHRALLTSLGWPPPLSALTSSYSDTRSAKQVSNPLLTMQADLRLKYSENFLALCNLQELQMQRKSRQLEGHDRQVALRQPLWVIEELVNPLSLASQRHFSKWMDKPEFIFTLVYKITSDYVNSMDEMLQPLVDEVKIVGYSCREEWISGMVTYLSTYLAKEIFPSYISQLEEESITGIRSSARISWLHLIDLMIAFDKRIKSLLEQSGILLSFDDDDVTQKISSLSVFCDRPDWLDLWAEIELGDALNKLKPDIEDENNWRKKVVAVALSSSTHDHKSPLVSSAFLRHLAAVIDRCRSLPRVTLRFRFLRLAGVPIIRKFFDSILNRCQEAEGLTALTDDEAAVKVAISVNAAHYLESVLKEWSEDVFFLEMGIDLDDKAELLSNANIDSEGLPESSRTILDDEIKKLEEFRTEWVEKISLVILRGFDARSRGYVKNKRQWQKVEEGWTVSKTLIEALDYLQGKMSVVEVALNSRDFVTVWRSLAAGVDRLIFNGILMSNVKFHNGGAERFSSDLEVLFGIFGAWCLRPEGFFPKVSEGLKLLKMDENRVQEYMAGGKRWLKENRIRHLSVTEAEKIVSSRVFTG